MKLSRIVLLAFALLLALFAGACSEGTPTEVDVDEAEVLENWSECPGDLVRGPYGCRSPGPGRGDIANGPP